MAQKQSFIKIITPACKRLASEQGLELCDVALEKEPQGSYLRIYLDKAGGLTLDDCERYHHAVQPMLEKYDYDFLEVCSPGIDRPLKTKRDVEKTLGLLVEVRLYKPLNGQKTYQGTLEGMDEQQVSILTNEGAAVFERKTVALVKLVPDLSALNDEDGDEQ